MKHLDVARAYQRADLCALPADLAAKRPDAGNWKQYQTRLPTDDELRRWFSRDRPMCLVAGKASKDLEMIDFDCAGEKFAWWRQLVEIAEPGLVDQLVLERSPSGGWHAAYRHESEIFGNLKLAERSVVVPCGEEVEFYGKKYKPVKVGDHYGVRLTLIETRGEGGIFLCDPTPGYVLTQGSFEQLPVLTEEQRMLLLEIAWSLNELKLDPEPSPDPTTNIGGDPNGRPGDDFNERGDIRPILRAHGWTLKRNGENEHWCRPGKSHGTSATLKDGVFYVFSSNAFPFEPGRGYSRFHTYTLLEHGKNEWSAAASELRREGYGNPYVAPAVRLNDPGPVDSVPPPEDERADPGPIPDSLLRVPGFVDEVMQYTLENAPYPDRALAFAAALSLQALLAGRKVRDAGDTRTNMYIVALANSGVGKDFPRKTNEKILIYAGMADCLGDEIGSAEGMLDDLEVTPTLLFQTDEIDFLMQAMNQPKEARYQRIMQALLKLFTSSNGLYVKRKKVGKQRGNIDQPCVCLFGTAIPDSFYKALSLKMLTNGWFARLLTVEANQRGDGRDDDEVADLPQSVLDTARWWVEFQPGQQGNLSGVHPQPRRIDATPEAKRRFKQYQQECNAEYRVGEDANNQARMAIWARAVEKAKKLALIYACSENHEEPVITEQAANWGCQLVTHQTRRMLFMAGLHVADSDFEARCKCVVEALHHWRKQRNDEWMPFRDLSRKLRWSKRDHDEIRATLQEQELIEVDFIKTSGRPKLAYRLPPAWF